VVDGIICESRRIRQANLIAVEKILSNIFEDPNSLVALVRNVVETFFKFSPAALFR